MRAGDLVGERFLLEAATRSGGMGQVFRARDEHTGGQVAVKLIERRFAKRFQREARLLVKLSHPAIVRYVAHGWAANGQPYLVTEWLEGETLRERLMRGRLAVADAVKLARRVAEALGAAHAGHVVHRDVKPDNLLLAEGSVERVTVLDFGIARQGANLGVTRTGELVGTPRYMAPEQARGSRHVDARVDVFALGCVLYECLAGRAAFAGDDATTVLARILLEEPPPLGRLVEGIPPALDDLVGRMLAKTVSARPSDGAAAAAELAALDEGTPLPSTTPGDPPAALTGGEQGVASVLLWTPPRRAAPAAPVDPDDTAAPPAPRERVPPAFRRIARARGGQIEPLLDGSVVVVMQATGDATDQAARVALLALQVRSLVPGGFLALGTGRGSDGIAWPVSEAVARAAALTPRDAREPGAGVCIDEVTAALLDARFEMVRAGANLELVGVSESLGHRKLLGRATPYVGRDRELGVLRGIHQACVADCEAGAVLITGPSGIGKSRLKAELLARIRTDVHAVEVWAGRGDLLSAGSPFGLIAPALRRAAGLRDGDPLGDRQAKLRAWVDAYGIADPERVTVFLAELLGAQFSDEGRTPLRVARRDAMIMGDQVRRAWLDLVAAASARGPLLIVLEDLHWGDLPTVKLIDAALAQLRDRPLLVLALARPEVHDQFPGLWAGRPLHEITLAPLGPNAGVKLVKAVLGDRVSAEVVARLVEQASGNPFFLEELIRAEAAAHGERIPESLLAIVEARLGAMEPIARRVLRAASIFGQVFWSGATASLLADGDRPQVAEWLEELEAREVVSKRHESRFSDSAEYSFRHVLVKEAAYAMLTEADRTLGHRLAATWLERSGEPDAGVMAAHWAAGGDGAKAIEWYERAAGQSLEGNDFTAALARVGRAVALGASGARLGGLRLIEAAAEYWRGETVRAEAAGQEALGLLPPGSPAWYQAVSHQNSASVRLGHRANIVELAGALAAFPLSREASVDQVIAWTRLATSLLTVGETERGAAIVEEVNRAAGHLATDPVVSAWLHIAAVIQGWVASDWEACAEHCKRAVADFELAGGTRYLLAWRQNLAYAYNRLGLYAEAETVARAAVEAATQLGVDSVQVYARSVLGVALGGLGRSEEARAVEVEVVERCVAQGDRRLEAAARAYLAEILLSMGDVAGASREIESAIQAGPAVPLEHAHAQGVCASVLLAQGDAQRAFETATRAMEIVKSVGGEAEASIRIAHAEALRAVGDLPGARDAIVTAREHLDRTAARIRNPSWRRAFLAMREHARIRELSKE